MIFKFFGDINASIDYGLRNTRNDNGDLVDFVCLRLAAVVNSSRKMERF